MRIHTLVASAALVAVGIPIGAVIPAAGPGAVAEPADSVAPRVAPLSVHGTSGAVGRSGAGWFPATKPSAPTTPAGGDGASSAPRLGTNLDSPADWSVEMAFVDLFKMSRPWVSSTDGGAWDDGRVLDLDEHGWVRSLEPGQIAQTVMLTDHSEYRPGTYDITYEGTGTLSIGRPTTEVAPGHLQVEMDGSPTLLLRLTATDPADPIRNIKVTAPGGTCADDMSLWAPDAGGCAANQYLPFLGNTEAILFNPEFVAKTAPFELVRFVDWMGTNRATTLAAWADRPLVADTEWFSNGVPVEVMIELSNRLDVHPWFNLPHLADDDFVVQFATMVRDTLEPGLVPYVEYTNEVWNGIFTQHQWAAQRGLELGLASTEWEAAWLYYARRATEVHKLWAGVYGGRDGIHLVTASQAANSYVAEQILAFEDTAEWTDSLAIAPYFGDVPNSEEEAAPLRAMTTQQYLDRIESVLLPMSIDWIRQNKALADRYGLPLTAYEGGQHLVNGFSMIDDPALNTLFDEANRDPRMGQIYARYLDAWEAEGGSVFVHYTSVSKWSKWGRWGALESLFQTGSPKFDALMGYLDRQPVPPTCPLPAG